MKLLTVENICSGPSSVSGLKSDFFCSVVRRYLIQLAIVDNDLETAQSDRYTPTEALNYNSLSVGQVCNIITKCWTEKLLPC